MPQGKSKLKTGCTTPKRLLGMVGNGWAVTRRKPKRRAKGGGRREASRGDEPVGDAVSLRGPLTARDGRRYR